MNRLVIIGNGFDLAHGLKTSYKDFIEWYIDGFLRELFNSEEEIIHRKDELLDIELFLQRQYTFCIQNTPYSCSAKVAYNSSRNEISRLDFLKRLGYFIERSAMRDSYVKESEFLRIIINNIENKGWTDIESDYYALLKENANNIDNCKNLNKQMDFLRDKLAEYLGEQRSEADISGVKSTFLSNIIKEDVAQSSKETIRPFVPRITFSNQQNNGYEVKRTMLLDFNYTSTTDKYKIDDTFSVNHIHGSLSNPEQMIFGYGDEMDKDFQELEDKNENELLKNSKSVKYLETDHYRRLLEFIEGGVFQVYIMGHSCGNSDRTLLNTIFEHENCISIKLFYYKWGAGENEDTYSDITRNIYRNFKDKVLFRDRMVNKTQCEAMPQVENAT